MTINWKIWLPIVLLVAVAAIIVGTRTQVKLPTEPAETEPTETEPAETEPAAPPTVDVDEIINDILNETSGEETSLNQALEDTELIDYDSQAISDFGQSYGEGGL